ncbi:hypothetical protein B0A48_14633 [Cryoendolithus antarcticus]|uniref:Uncharacterized protein n=1 Tax=Cryoendolithus antarcticus TaxID=1507870 RepID=A0A1V8SLB1_9PEZI|nr:hypothetical protein B0A48_14633 [Cryoendolithus antarcticus]
MSSPISISPSTLSVSAHSPASSLSPSTPSYSSSSSLPSLNGSPSTPGNLSKAPVVSASTRSKERIQPRRPSLMGTLLSGAEYTVVDLARGGEGTRRLVTCIKSSQGFDWNQELFLPSYIHRQSEDWERRADPVHEIMLTDEEAASILPQ